MSIGVALLISEAALVLPILQTFRIVPCFVFNSGDVPRPSYASECLVAFVAAAVIGIMLVLGRRKGNVRGAKCILRPIGVVLLGFNIYLGARMLDEDSYMNPLAFGSADCDGYGALEYCRDGMETNMLLTGKYPGDIREVARVLSRRSPYESGGDPLDNYHMLRSVWYVSGVASDDAPSVVVAMVPPGAFYSKQRSAYYMTKAGKMTRMAEWSWKLRHRRGSWLCGSKDREALARMRQRIRLLTATNEVPIVWE